jgi:hypothetical protein
MMMKRLRPLLSVLVAIVATWWLTSTSVSGQSSVPNGVFVRNSAGSLWLVLDGQRVKIPVWAATDDEIEAIPVPERWAVLNEAGAIVAGDRPAWLADQDVPAPTPPPATLASTTPPVRAVRIDPTPTVLPTLTPTSQASTDSLTFKGLTVKVLKIERGWKSDNQFTKPKDGNEFLTMDVRIDNSTSGQLDMNPARFKVVTEDGARWDRQSARDPYLRLGDVIPGTPMRGWLTFEVPKQLGVIQLLWEADYSTTLVLPIKA